MIARSEPRLSGPRERAFDILAIMSRGWKRDPAGVALGTERTGVSAALWTHDTEDVQEVWGAPADAHLISFQLAPYWAELTVDGKHAYTADLRRGDLSLVRAGSSPRAIQRGSWSVLHMYLPDALVTDYADQMLSVSGRAVELSDARVFRDPVFTRIAREILTEMLQSRPLSCLRVDTLGQDLAIQLLRRWSNFAGTRAFTRELERQRRGGLAPWQVRRVTEYLEAHLAGDVRLAALAGLVGLSPSHFCTAFHISQGEPPHRWLLRRRIERGKEMLADPRLSVTDIALAVGFSSSAHFATAFRKQEGVTPSSYRRACVARALKPE